MSFHPHLHTIVSAGGWDDLNQRWMPAQKLKKGFFMPQKVLAACFKKHFLFAFSQLWEDNKLLLPKDLMHLNMPHEFKKFYHEIAFKKNWIVKIMPPLDNPQRVIEYLGRYIYRIAITDSRIKEVKIHDRVVVFDYKDYADQSNQSDKSQPPPLKTMSLDALEFIRRFAQHILPKSFQKTRYFGLYATAGRAKISTKITAHLGKLSWIKSVRSVCQIIIAFTGADPNICPCCGGQKLVVIPILPTMPKKPKNNLINLKTRPPPVNF
jgi:Putative transposase